MTQSELAELQAVCANIIEAGADVLHWSWDDYKAAALATLKPPAGEKALEVVDRAFAEHWTSDTVSESPDAKAIADAAGGGLRPGQRLFLQCAGSIWLIGMWWPWGDRQTVSLRIGLLDTSDDDGAAARNDEQLRSWFGI